MKTRRGWVQGYNDQAVVTRDQIILAAAITNAANDVQQLGGMLAQAEGNAALAHDAMPALQWRECLLAINEFSSDCECRCYTPVCIGASQAAPLRPLTSVGPPFAFTVEFDCGEIQDRGPPFFDHFRRIMQKYNTLQMRAYGRTINLYGSL